MQVEVANKVIMQGIKRRLSDAKRRWVEKLYSILWAYRMKLHSTTGETPFRLAYRIQAVIPVEVRELSCRTKAPLNEEMNEEALREELNLVEEIRVGVSLREATLKQKITLRHNAKFIKRKFPVGSLVLRRNHKNSSQTGKALTASRKK